MRETCLRGLPNSPFRRLAALGALLIAVLAIGRSDAAAQSVTLEYQQVATRRIPGATAALSLDPSRVGASVEDGLVTVIGRGPGATNVVVIAGDETMTLRVVVGEPPLIVLPGMGRSGSSSGPTGYYEARYGSNPGIVQGSVFFSRRDGERLAEAALGGAAPLGPHMGSPFSVPQASFTLRTPDREITLLDRVVSHSPLTISGSNLRGLFLREGPWQVNAGYSFFSTFEHLLLPTAREGVAGLSYRHRLTPRSTLTPNLFYFDGPTPGRPRRALGSLLYETRTSSDATLVAELGMSRSLGGALEFDLDRPNRRAWAKVRVAPSDLPSLTTANQSGRQLEGGWIWQGDKTGLNATVSSRRYSQPGVDQTSSVASLDVQRRLTPRWVIHGGSGGSIFENRAQTASSISNLSLPLGTSFSGRNLGAGIDYQFSRETTRDLGGHLLRVNLNGSARGFRASAFGERQTQAPTARRILTEVPWLQPMLDRLGLAATSPQQIADLFRTNAELSSYGYANSIQLDVTPVRFRLGATGSWSGSGARRPQLSANTLFNRDASVGRTSSGAVHSLRYSQKLDAATDLFLTWSALCHDRVVSSSCHPVMFASLRRAVSGAPGFLGPRGGHIEGVVFRDDRAQGVYTPGLPPVADVEVVLDNVRYTRTDSAGRFRFDAVPNGTHRVEARYASDGPIFFTTPSPADVETGASVHFGIARSRPTLRGVVVADGGAGLGGVLVHIADADRRITVRTSDDGTFVGEGLPNGDYEVTVDRGSVPAGYPVDTLLPQRVRIADAAPGRARFVLRPYRSVGGRARLFDRQSGQYLAMRGARVELLPLGRESVTDDNGHYVFRNLPAGQYTIVVRHDGREHIAAATVPEGPTLVKDVDVAVLPAASAPSLHADAGERRRVSLPAGEGRYSSAKAVGLGLRNAFTIQVAESTSARHARAMVDELKSAGHAAYLEPPASGLTAQYRVRVGQFVTRADAIQSARTLESALGWQMTVTAISAQPVVRGHTVSYVR